MAQGDQPHRYVVFALQTFRYHIIAGQLLPMVGLQGRDQGRVIGFR